MQLKKTDENEKKVTQKKVRKVWKMGGDPVPPQNEHYELYDNAPSFFFAFWKMLWDPPGIFVGHCMIE